MWWREPQRGAEHTSWTPSHTALVNWIIKQVQITFLMALRDGGYRNWTESVKPFVPQSTKQSTSPRTPRYTITFDLIWFDWTEVVENMQGLTNLLDLCISMLMFHHQLQISKTHNTISWEPQNCSHLLAITEKLLLVAQFCRINFCLLREAQWSSSISGAFKVLIICFTLLTDLILNKCFYRFLYICLLIFMMGSPMKKCLKALCLVGGERCHTMWSSLDQFIDLFNKLSSDVKRCCSCWVGTEK